MRRGRKPKSTAEKKLAGNPGMRPYNKHEPKLKKQKPRMPGYLSAEAKREWRRIVPQLDRIGMLTQMDRATLVMYCEAWATFKDANDVIQETNIVIRNSNGNLVRNPMAIVRDSAFDQIYKLSSLYGFDPSTRSRLVVIPDDEEIDPLEELLFKRQVNVYDKE